MLAESCPELLAKWASAEVSQPEGILCQQSKHKSTEYEQTEAGVRLSTKSFSQIIFLLGLAKELYCGLQFQGPPNPPPSLPAPVSAPNHIRLWMPHSLDYFVPMGIGEAPCSYPRTPVLRKLTHTEEIKFFIKTVYLILDGRKDVKFQDGN